LSVVVVSLTQPKRPWLMVVWTVDAAVDGGGVERGLVDHAVVDGGDDDPRKVSDLGVGPLVDPGLKGCDCKELDLDC
jgi:hypothetical protein